MINSVPNRVCYIFFILIVYLFSISSYANDRGSSRTKKRTIASESESTQKSYICTNTDATGKGYSFPCDSEGRSLLNGGAVSDILVDLDSPSNGSTSNGGTGSNAELEKYVSECTSGFKKDFIDCVKEFKKQQSNVADPLETNVASCTGDLVPMGASQCVTKTEACRLCQINGTCDQYAQYGCLTNSSSTPEGDNNTAAVAQSQINACHQASIDIQSDCNPEAKGWMQEMNGVIQAIGPAFQAQQGTCTSLSAVDTATKGALATFSVMCSNSYNKCRSACQQASASLNTPAFFDFSSNKQTVNMHLQTCEKWGAHGKDAEQRASQAAQQITAAIQTCRANLGGGDTMAAFCAKPENANADACRVGLGTQLPINTAAIGGNAGMGMNHQGVGDRAGDAAGSGQEYGMENIDDGSENPFVKPHAAKPGEEIGGAKGGGRVAMGDSGGGGAGPAGSGNRGSGGGGLVSNILSGFFGGGGGGSGSRGSGGGGGWRSLFGGGSGSSPGNGQAQNKMPDLRQFMPGGLKDPNKHRGIAGQWVGKDGMSGPHANIWKMINNRYQYKRATLLP